MKICLLTTSYPTWNERQNEFVRGKFVHDMAKYLVRAGLDVYVVTQHDKDTKSYEVKDGVNIFRFHYFVSKYESLTRTPGIPENIKKLKNKLLVPFYLFCFTWHSFKILRKNRITILNAHWGFPTGYVGLILKKLIRGKLIITLYGAELFPLVNGRLKLVKPLLAAALQGADALAGISAETVKSAEIISGRNNIHLIPDGIDMAYYQPGRKNDELLAKYNCKGERVVFFTGRMVERKGHRFLLEAMGYLNATGHAAKLVLGGHGPLYDELMKLRTALDLEEIVEMPGFLPEDELVPLLQSIDIFVLPSFVDSNGDTEGSATAAFEAMACGTPALISRIGGNIGAIEEGKGAYYFEAGNSKDLARKILMLLSDNDLLEQNKSESRNFIANNYSWDRSVARYLQLLNKDS